MSHHEIHDPWPFIYWKRSDSFVQFHLKDINWAISKPWRKREFNFWEKRYSREIFTSHWLCIPLSFKVWTHCSAPNLFLLWWRNSLSPLYEVSFGGVLKWWRPSWKGLSFSVSKHVDTEVCQLYTFVDHNLIEILFSHPIDILKIFELLFHGNIFDEC